MNTKAIGRRVARLEQAARTAYTAWVETLADDELDERYNAISANQRAIYDTLTDDELERLATGRMTRYEWQRHLQHTRRTNDTQ